MNNTSPSTSFLQKSRCSRCFLTLYGTSRTEDNASFKICSSRHSVTKWLLHLSNFVSSAYQQVVLENHFITAFAITPRKAWQYRRTAKRQANTWNSFVSPYNRYLAYFTIALIVIIFILEYKIICSNWSVLIIYHSVPSTIC